MPRTYPLLLILLISCVGCTPPPVRIQLSALEVMDYNHGGIPPNAAHTIDSTFKKNQEQGFILQTEKETYTTGDAIRCTFHNHSADTVWLDTPPAHRTGRPLEPWYTDTKMLAQDSFVCQSPRIRGILLYAPQLANLYQLSPLPTVSTGGTAHLSVAPGDRLTFILSPAVYNGPSRIVLVRHQSYMDYRIMGGQMIYSNLFSVR